MIVLKTYYKYNKQKTKKIILYKNVNVFNNKTKYYMGLFFHFFLLIN